ncbi:MAG: membrane protein insertase YidC [Candidatus Omnitrophica bacterium]|nr:membrane protein insertase YidC [Candidatus Omnitrophota bacterium]MDD5552472.1 membrane protein insertase YidC [Candidatus Omnitrophota bacterium]
METEKRLFLAIALALVVLLSWSTFASKRYPIENKQVTTSTASVKPFSRVQPLPQIPESTDDTETNFPHEKYDIVFSESRAAVKSINFKSYQNYVFPLKSGFQLNQPGLNFKTKEIDRKNAIFAHTDAAKEIIKKFDFSKSNYTIGLEITVKNFSTNTLKMALPVILGELSSAGGHEEARLRDVTFAGRDKITHLNLRKEAEQEEIKFVALRDRYFCAILSPIASTYNGYLSKKSAQDYEIGVLGPEFEVLPGEEKIFNFDIYLGPQELRQISNINPDWTAVMYYGTFDFIAHLLLQLLYFIFGLLRNWGLTIVVISVIIYFILFPLSLKQMHSMKQMQVLQPRIEELRKAYKNNPQKLNAEIMQLYKTYKVNPFSGCLPLILQIPIFFALYQVLIRSVALKGASFLWIKDLSAPDRLFLLPFSLPVLGNEINLLPILMTIGMFVQQKFSMATATSGSAEQQKLMLILMPLMFGFIFYHMPSGLVLYWFTNSTLMLVYQLKINRQK